MKTKFSLKMIIVIIFWSLISQLLADQKLEKFKKFNLAKSKFWELELRWIEVNSKKYYPGKPENKKILIPINRTIRFYGAFYIKSPHRANITKYDAQYWGSGKHKFEVYVGIPPSGPSKLFIMELPKFTYDEIQTWSIVGRWWIKKVGLEWTGGQYGLPHPIRVGKYGSTFQVDRQNDIPEPDESNNFELMYPEIIVYDKFKAIDIKE